MLICGFSETLSVPSKGHKPKEFLISAEERLIIENYRKYPELQDAVKRVLNMESGFKTPEEDLNKTE